MKRQPRQTVLTPAEEENLIALVHENTLLWAKQDNNYKNNYLRSQCWNKIACQLGVDKETVQHRWKTLRNKYNQENNIIKSTRSGAGLDDAIFSPWKYYESLTFLSDSEKTADLESNLGDLFKDDQDYNLHVPDLSDADKMNQREILDSKIERKDMNAFNQELEFYRTMLEHVVKIPKKESMAYKSDLGKLIFSYAYPEVEWNDKLDSFLKKIQKTDSTDSKLSKRRKTNTLVVQNPSTTTIELSSDDESTDYVLKIKQEKEVPAYPRVVKTEKEDNKQCYNQPTGNTHLLQHKQPRLEYHPPPLIQHRQPQSGHFLPPHLQYPYAIPYSSFYPYALPPASQETQLPQFYGHYGQLHPQTLDRPKNQQQCNVVNHTQTQSKTSLPVHQDSEKESTVNQQQSGNSKEMQQSDI